MVQILQYVTDAEATVSGVLIELTQVSSSQAIAVALSGVSYHFEFFRVTYLMFHCVPFVEL